MPGQLWEVIGGVDKGGILVRTRKALDSPPTQSRLSTGALVRELTLDGERLEFERLTGNGPPTGWVSIRLPAGKALVVPTDKQPPPPPPTVTAQAPPSPSKEGVAAVDHVAEAVAAELPATLPSPQFADVAGVETVPLSAEETTTGEPAASEKEEEKEVKGVMEEPSDTAGLAAPGCVAEEEGEKVVAAVTSPPDSAETLLAENRPMEALDLISKLLSSRPPPSASQRYKLRKQQLEVRLHPSYTAATSQGAASKRDSPLHLAQSLAAEQPSDLPAQLLLGRTLCLEGKRKEAEEVWKRAAGAQQAGQSDAQRLLRSLVVVEDEKARGNVAFKEGRWEDACKAYTRALDADPLRLDREMASAILGNRSAARRKLLQPEDALRDAEESRQLSPSYAKARFRRALALLELERYEDAMADLQETKALDPKLAGLDDWMERAKHWSFAKPRSHYAALGVPIDATQEDIKKAHKRMALKWHPDKAGEEERQECESRFKAAQEAFEVLSDSKQRELHDFGRVKPPPIEEKPMPKALFRMGWTVRKGDGLNSCMCCGFRVPPELAHKAVLIKKAHIQETGHPGFYDK